MKSSQKTGFSFGLTSGVITTLGLMVGLYASTSLKSVVIGGILAIAIADSFSDALGIHVSEESENKHSTREIWEATLSTFFFKLFFALTFVVPVLLLELPTAILISLAWGFLLLTAISYNIAKKRKEKPIKVIFEHVAIATLVIIATNYVGGLINKVFG